MWTWHKETWKSWYMVSHLQYGWAMYRVEHGENPIQDLYETPQGWFLLSFWHMRWYTSYSLVLTDNGRFVEEYTLTFDEFESFPTMAPGFFIPF